MSSTETIRPVLAYCTTGLLAGNAHDPRGCNHGGPDGYGWSRNGRVGVRIMVGTDRLIRGDRVGSYGGAARVIGRVVDADTIDVGSNRWVASCEEFYAWHIDGTTAWGMCRAGDHSCCTYSLERVLAGAPFHYSA